MQQPLGIQPGFHAIHANQLEDLRRVVVWICSNNPIAPLESETFLVQSNGIAQWLKLALAEKKSDDASEGGLGIAAGMSFLFPARFIWQAYRAILPEGEVPEQSPFEKQRLVWRLYRLLPELVDTDDVFAPLRRFLQGTDTDLRRYQLAEKLADLFDQYQVFRADWLSLWEAGRNTLISSKGETKEMEPELRWQPLLWRKLVEDVGEESHTSRSQVHTRFLEIGKNLTALPNPGKLPRRIIVFGVSSLPRQALEVLHVLSRFSQVILCVHNPCQYYWADIISDRELLKAERKRGVPHPGLSQASDPDQLHQHANPLLAAWGKQGRDYIRLLDEFDNPEEYRSNFQTPNQSIDIYTDHGDGAGRPRVLHQLQNDILNLTSVTEMKAEKRKLDLSADHSLVFHEAHSAQREVEILHDQLLAAFNLEPDLRPRDIIVMVPDINDYAPHIQAVFGRYHYGSKRYIPFTISDQGQRHQEPVLIALETLLSLPQSRFGVSEIVSLLEVPGVRQRFDIAPVDIPVLRNWIEGVNIRWGLHDSHRASLSLPDTLDRNTWTSGLRSMLLGYGMGDDESWHGVEPYPEIGGLQASLAGKLSQFVHHLEHVWEQLNQSHTPRDWQILLSGMLDEFFFKVEGQDLLLLNRFRRQLEQWHENAVAAGLSDEILPLNIVKDVLLEGLDEAGLNQRFLAGKVNFATLMPMRAIPFKRVCLLGMNDGDYPRSRPPVDFDLMAQEYRPGDRSRREDDRYLFLEAMLSARQQLYISWVARSIKDDSERPPSVLIGQLRDHLNGHWQLSGDFEVPVAKALTTSHPLQPFSRRYFPASTAINRDDPEALDDIVKSRRLFTYEREWLSAYKVSKDTDITGKPLVYQAPQEPISLRDLASFLKKPIENFYQHRLKIWFEQIEDNDSDNENFDLNGLSKWQLDNELISSCLIKANSSDELLEKVEQTLDRMARRGDLGMGITEQKLRDDLAGRLPDMFERYEKAQSEWPELLAEPIVFEHQHSGDQCSIAVADLIDGVRLNSAGEHCRVVIARSSLLKGSGSSRKTNYANLLGDWVTHLAGQLTDYPFETLILAKEEGRKFRFPKMTPEDAESHFNAILEGWMQGTTEPLPLQCEAGFSWIYSMYQSQDYKGDEARAQEKAEEAYEAALNNDNGYLHGAYAGFNELLEAGRFKTLVEALYYPLWEAEQSKAGEKTKS